MKRGSPKKLAALAPIAVLAITLGACSTTSSGTNAASTAKAAAAKPTTETISGRITGKAVLANTTAFPLTLTGVVNTTGKVTLPSGNGTHKTITFYTEAGNLVAAASAPDANNPPTTTNKSTCRFTSTIHATYTVAGGKSTGKFAGATGHGTATVVFSAIAPRYPSGKQQGQCNESNNAQPLAAGAYASFHSTGPLKLK